MRFLISLLIIPFLFSYAIAFLSVLNNFNLVPVNQFYFWLFLVISFSLNLIFRNQSSYISIFKHELTHNIFAILTFNKPIGFTVKKDIGGEFEYQGKSNYLITLSPYFFPTSSSFFILIFFLKPNNQILYYTLLGFFSGFDLSSILKDIHPAQPDLKEYGFIFSLLMALFGIIFFWGILFSFVIGGWDLSFDFIKLGITYYLDLL